jgi:hypothetical protein
MDYDVFVSLMTKMSGKELNPSIDQRGLNGFFGMTFAFIFILTFIGQIFLISYDTYNLYL